jgi:hypothetical protein
MISIDKEDCQEGKGPNWTMYLVWIMSAINSMEQRGRISVSAFEAVFGLPLGRKEQCSSYCLTNCSIVQERLNLVKCPRFDSVAKYYVQLMTILLTLKLPPKMKKMMNGPL